MQPATTNATSIGPIFFTTADVNGDGKLDLIAGSGDTGGTISVLFGNGNGGLRISTTFATAYEPSSVALVDMNGDGKPDLAVSSEGTNTVSVAPATKVAATLEPQRPISV